MNNKSIEQGRRWLSEGERPSKLFYFRLYTGDKGEADNPLALFDLLVDPDYSDCDDRKTHLLMLGDFLKDIASHHLGAVGIKTEVYDGVGKLFDNAGVRYQDERDEQQEVVFENPDSPVVLDFWDEYTVLTSLIRCGYLQIYEKIPFLHTSHQEFDCKSCFFFEKERGSCPVWNADNTLGRMDKYCPFWTKDGATGRYLEVTPEVLPKEPTWKKAYKLLEDRHFLYPLYFGDEKLNQILLTNRESEDFLEEE